MVAGVSALARPARCSEPLMLNDFHFLRPWWWLALVPLALLLWRLSRGDASSDIWREICDPRLLPYLLVGSTIQRRWWLRLVGFAWLASLIALAGPTWTKLEQPIFKGKTALVIVLDLSLSMDAADLKPSRLTRARFKVLDMLDSAREGQVALVVHAEDAFVVAPLTDDAHTIAAIVPVLTAQIMPRQGSRVVRALRKADELLEQAGISGGEIVVVTDGVNELEETLEVTRESHSHGRRISFLGVGTIQGAPIPLADGGLLKDADGAIVVPKLDPSALSVLAEAGGGRFSPITTDGLDLATILSEQGSSWFAAADATLLSADQWREDGIWLVLLLLPLACLAFRRGWVLMVLLGITLSPPRVDALEWKVLWFRADQQGAKAMQAGDPFEAATLFNNSAWAATAHYRAGNFDLALAQFAVSATPDAHYNRGNTLVRLGDLRNAISAYDLALEQQPQHTDALHNKTVLEKFLHQLEQASEGADPRRRPQGESSASRGLGPEGQGGNGDSDDEIARREEESEEFEERTQSGMDEEYQPDLNEEFSLSELQGSRYSSTSRSGQQGEDNRALQSLDDPSSGGANRSAAGTGDDRPTTLTAEEQQALEQWLRRIPDDPGGLLRRKLLLEHRRRQLAGGYDYSATPW